MKEEIRFYRWAGTLSDSFVTAVLTEQTDSSDELPQSMRLLTGHGIDPNATVPCIQNGGVVWADVMKMEFTFLLSERLRTELRQSEISGWREFPCALKTTQGATVDTYAGLTVTGRSGPIDFGLATVVESAIVNHGPIRRRFRGPDPGLDYWDGSDIFLSRGLFAVYVTHRAASVLGSFSNVVLQNIDEDEYSEFTAGVLKQNVQNNKKFF
jgi:hypothetical protein